MAFNKKCTKLSTYGCSSTILLSLIQLWLDLKFLGGGFEELHVFHQIDFSIE